MAFSDSIKWNGKSIRDLFAEITEVRGRGKPALKTSDVDLPGRHGRITFKQTYKPRVIEIEGTIEGSSHASLMSNIENVKSLFAMEDETLPPGEESIADGMKYGRLEFGDESGRHYRAVFDGIFEFPELSHRWMSNDMKLFRARFRCDDPFSYGNTISEVTMSAKANEFKKINTGTMRSKPVIELKGAVTNPMIVEGDKTAVVHFDYNDNLSDVTLSTVSGNFTNKFGYRSVKSLTTRQSKAIQLTGSDSLYYDRGSIVNGLNYTNFNPYQGTIMFWLKPYFDGDDNKNHSIFHEAGNSSNDIFIEKTGGNTLRVSLMAGGTNRTATINVTSSNFAAGTWYFLVVRWDTKNSFDGTNYLGIRLDSADSESSSALGVPTAVDETLSIGQVSTNIATDIFDGLIHWQIYERALTDSEVTDLYNSGAGVEPFVTPDTKLLSAGELSSGDPVSVQYPWVDNEFADGNQENDPSIEWTFGGSGGTGANTAVTNNTSTVKYDLQSAKLTWVSAAADALMYSTTVELVFPHGYFYRLWVYFETLHASDEMELIATTAGLVFTRRLDTGTDDLGVAFATGKWLYYEGTFKTAGSAGLEFRFKKINANGDATLYVDQMDCHEVETINPSFEGTYSSGVAPNWTKAGTGTLTEENADTHSGIAAQKLVGTSGLQFRQNFSGVLVDNAWYLFSCWVKRTAGSAGLSAQFTDFSGGDITFFTGFGASEWTKITALFQYDALLTFFYFGIGNGDTWLIDDTSIIELDKVTANVAS
ncbi:MAG: phage tail family protein, partial [Candidatus Marinimicrobia bacterium]|nr:phage tail family protein [Candidatus Neomarinimicrobiota bacterium]